MHDVLTRCLSLLVLPLLALTLTACGGSNDTASDVPSGSPTSSTSPSSSAPAGECSYPADGSSSTATAPSPAPKATGSVKATLHLSAGDVALTLDGADAPCTVNSFLSLAAQGYFDKTRCHRLTTSGIFVLQCGDPTGTGRGGPGYSFADELKAAQALKDDAAAPGAKNYAAGTLAMANAGPDTNGSQFFLVYADSPLPPAYSVFGTFDKAGLKVVRAIAAKGLGTDGVAPAQTVTITSVTTR